jgi:hypothetical protein
MFHWPVLSAFPLRFGYTRNRVLFLRQNPESVVDSSLALQLDLTVRRESWIWPATGPTQTSQGAGENEMTGLKFTGLRLAATVLATALLAGPLTGRCWAQDYPTRPIRIIVPFGAGGPADVAARLIGNILQESLGQPMVIENRPGAGGVIGTLEAARSAPDGYTLLMMSNTQTANESLVPQRKYQLMRDLVAIAPVNFADLVIVVHPSVPATTLKEFIALAKSQPGKLNYALSHGRRVV